MCVQCLPMYDPLPMLTDLQWVLDVLICNWIGIHLGTSRLSLAVLQVSSAIYDRSYHLGMKTCQYFEVKVNPLTWTSEMLIVCSLTSCPLCWQGYTWRGFKQIRGVRGKTRRVISQFSPADWTTFKWEGTADFTHYVAVVLLLAVFLAAELNPFYLKVIVLHGARSDMASHLNSRGRPYCGWNPSIPL
jgi:phosphatidylserine synthase 2